MRQVVGPSVPFPIPDIRENGSTWDDQRPQCGQATKEKAGHIQFETCFASTLCATSCRQPDWSRGRERAHSYRLCTFGEWLLCRIRRKPFSTIGNSAKLWSQITVWREVSIFLSPSVFFDGYDWARCFLQKPPFSRQ